MKADAELDKKMASFDFSTAKKACDVPALQKLRENLVSAFASVNLEFDVTEEELAEDKIIIDKIVAGETTIEAEKAKLIALWKQING